MFSIRLLSISLIINYLPLSAKYWQQEVDYQINVTLSPNELSLNGDIVIAYTNNSPDTLKFIYLHCWANAYSSENTPLAKELSNKGNNLLIRESAYRGYMNGLDFKVEGVKSNWEITDAHGEIVKINLPNPLLPKQKVSIASPFFVKMPSALISRMGHLNNAFQLTQWYPKPAVYDENGWHTMPYLNQGEFFSEFGNYEVTITLPDNYLVASTGNLTPESREREKNFLETKLRWTDDILKNYPLKQDNNVIEFPVLPTPEISLNNKTLSYSQKKVHDFAWFADMRWMVTQEELELAPNKKVRTYAYFLPENIGHWRNSQEIMHKALKFYSEEVGLYPHQKITAVDGSIMAGAGMEYPKITIIGESASELEFEEVLIHEIGHNWFYGMLASDERNFPWMDEGLNSYFELKYFEKHYQNRTLGDLYGNDLGTVVDFLIGQEEKPIREYYYESYISRASRRIDQAIDLPAHEYSDKNYAAIVYAKTAIVFRHLEEYLGEGVMREIFHTYFKLYAGKHVYPENFWAVAEDISGKNLSWVYEGLFSTAKLDYGVASANYADATKNLEVLVKNYGEIAAPFSITALRNGEEIKTFWFEGFEGSRVLDLGDIKADMVYIDYYELTPEFNKNNNRYKLNSLFGGIESPRFYPITSLDHGTTNEIFFIPFVGFNQIDQLKVGVILHNYGVVEKPFRFLLTPNYGFGSNNLTGYYKGIYSFYPAKAFRKINVYGLYRNETFPGVSGTFGCLAKHEFGTQFFIKKPHAKSLFEQRIDFRFTQTFIYQDHAKKDANDYLTLSYFGTQKKGLNPFKIEANVQLINWDLVKVFASAKQEYVLHKKSLTSLGIRWFGGAFLNTPGPRDQRHRLRLNAHNGAGIMSTDNEGNFNMTGMVDYLYDDIFFGRFENNSLNVFNKQIFIQDGGFRSPVEIGASASWLSALNFTLNTPFKYLALFGDFGYFGSDKARGAYGAGVQLSIVKNYFEIYFPVRFGAIEEFSFEQTEYTNYFQQMRFMLDLSKIFKIIN